MPDRHRVMIISHGHPAVSPGGGENAAYALFRGLRAQPNVETLFVAREQPEPSQGAVLGQASSDGSEILLRTEIEFFRFSQRHRRTVYRDFRSLLEWFRPTIVHFHHYVHLGLELVREVHNHDPDVPIVMTLHEYLAICNNDGQMVRTYDQGLCPKATPAACHRCFPDIAPQDFYLRESYIKSFLGLVDLFVAPSEFLIGRYIDWGLPADRFVMIENGLLASSGGPARQREEGSGRRFGFFGQIIPLKGLDVLLEAMTLLPQGLQEGPDRVTLDVHGSRLTEQTVPFQALIRERLKRAGPAVRMHGPYSPSDLPALMSSVDWVVVPSRWWENSPLVIQEAFANGVPVICSGVGGMAEKVSDGLNGLHFRLGDAHHLARRMVEAATSPGLRDRLRAGIPRVSTASQMAEAHLAHYDRLVAPGRAKVERAAPGTARAEPLMPLAHE